MPSHLDIVYQGVRGGNHKYMLNKAEVEIQVDTPYNKIMVDAFDSRGSSYKRWDNCGVIISKGASNFVFRTFDDLIKCLERGMKN